MPNHTPGPWYANKTDSHQGLVSSEVDGITIAITMASKDAALVAAAPRMFHALEACVEAIPYIPRDKTSPYDQKLREACQVAFEAILAAKGA